MAHHVKTAAAQPAIDAETVSAMQDLTRAVHVERDLYEYAVGLTEYTRKDPRVILGASPRATLGLIQVAKAAAILQGRGFTTPDDLRAYAVPVIAHRLVMSDEVDADHQARIDVVKAALSRVSYRKAIRPV